MRVERETSLSLSLETRHQSEEMSTSMLPVLELPDLDQKSIPGLDNGTSESSNYMIFRNHKKASPHQAKTGLRRDVIKKTIFRALKRYCEAQLKERAFDIGGLTIIRQTENRVPSLSKLDLIQTIDQVIQQDPHKKQPGLVRPL